MKARKCNTQTKWGNVAVVDNGIEVGSLLGREGREEG